MWKKSLRLTSSTEKQPRNPSGQALFYAALPLHPLTLRVQEGGKVMHLSGTDWIYEEAPQDSDPEVFLGELRSMLDFLLLPLPASPVQPEDHWEAQTQLPVLGLLPGYDLINQRHSLSRTGTQGPGGSSHFLPARASPIEYDPAAARGHPSRAGTR